VDGTNTEFVIMFRGAALFVRSIPVGAKHFAAAKEGYKARFIEEFKKSIDTYQSENIDAMPKQVYLGGATRDFESLIFAIEDQFKVSVKRVSDLDMLTVQPALKEKCVGQNMALLTVSAPGILADDLTVDLSPEENKLKRNLEERSRHLIKTAMLSMILIGVLSLWFACYMYLKTARLDELTKRYEPIRKETESLEVAYAKIKSVKARLMLRGKALDVTTELFSYLSSDLYLTDVKYESDGKMSVKGSAFQKDSIFALVDQMKSSSLFKNVQTKYITERKEGEVSVADFEISMTAN
jgi:hypothetical protein